MKIGFVSLGCPKNLVDGEVMLGIAQQAGHEITPDATDADVLVVNTCAFIDRAKQESIDAILEMAQQKRDGQLHAPRRHRLPRRAVPRRAEEGDPGDRRGARDGRSAGHRRRTRSRCGDRGRGDRSWRAIAGDIAPLTFYTKARIRHPTVRTPDHRTSRRRCPPTSTTPTRRALLTTPQHFAYVKIAEGCDYTCAFCIIPTLRGQYRSRTRESIVREARALAGARRAASCC